MFRKVVELKDAAVEPIARYYLDLLTSTEGEKSTNNTNKH